MFWPCFMFKVPNWHLEHSSAVIWNIKSGGNLSIFRLTAQFDVSQPHDTAKLLNSSATISMSSEYKKDSTIADAVLDSLTYF